VAILALFRFNGCQGGPPAGASSVVVEVAMNLELTEREARLMRAQLVRHIVELEDELSRSGPSAVGRTLAVEIRTLREIYTRLTGMLDSEGHRSVFPVAKVAP
jgi:hypothetical protein